MRKYKNSLLAGDIHSLLITGSGGQGKTSLAGKLALDLQAHGYRLFAWSARPENSWRDFELEMEQTLDRPRVDRYDKFLPRAENESARAQFMLDLLIEQFNGRVVLFLDNIETIQDADTLALKDATVEAWLRAANQAQGMILLVTSRWQIPDWDGKHEPLTHVNYGDFLQIAQRLSLPPTFLTRRNSLRQVYDILGGNVRGLEFFASAVRHMENADEENAFLEKLSTVKEDLQANMAIETIYNRLPADAKTLLHRLPASHEPVPMEGLLKLAPDLPNPESLLERLLAVSLLEASYEPHWKVNEYQCPLLVADWMMENGLVDSSIEWLNAAADYHLYLFEQERNTMSQVITACHVLRRAERHAKADDLILQYVREPLERAGFYMTLLEDWLPKVCNSEDLYTRGRALNDMGELYWRINDYDNALSCMEQSLVMRKEIDDKVGQSTTLSNISLIYQALGDYETALIYLNQSIVISQQIDNKENESGALSNIALIFKAQGDYEVALTYLKQALVIVKQIGKKATESAIINNISQIFKARGDYKTALHYMKQSLAINQHLGDKDGEGVMFGNIALILDAQGDYETALTYLKQSLAIFQEIGGREKEGTALGNIALILNAQGDYETALTYQKRSLAIFQEIGGREKEGTALNNIGSIYHAQGDYETALTYLNQSLAVSQRIGNKENEGNVLNNISQIFDEQGDYETALTYLNQSLAISQQIGNKKTEGAVLNNISQIYNTQGSYEMAMTYLEHSLAISQQLGDKRGEGVILGNIAQIFEVQGDYETALTYLNQSLAISQQIGNKKDESRAINSIAQIYYALGDYETALTYLKQPLAISQQIGDKDGEGTALNNIALNFHAQGDYPMALTYYKQSLAIRQLINNKAGLCTTLFNMGHIYVQNNQMQDGISAWVTSYTIATQIGHAKILQALSKLSPRLGLPEGLDGWKQLAQHMQSVKE